MHNTAMTEGVPKTEAKELEMTWAENSNIWSLYHVIFVTESMFSSIIVLNT